MRCATLSFVIAVALLAGAAPARGDWHEFWHRVHIDWHRMNCWPKPFNRIDRDATVAPMYAMVNKGWRLQNTLAHDHFDRENQQLNEAGQIKLRWILTQAPEQHRAVYVLRGLTNETTEVRLDSVQQLAAQIVQNGQLPSISPTDYEPRGWPADYIDAIDRKAQSSIPEPRLSQQTNSGTSGSN